MAYILELPTFSDDRGDLTVIEKKLPFEIKRVYYIYNTKNQCRGGHKHKKNIQALISIHGKCEIRCESETFILDNPKICLILDPQDYHEMCEFTNDCVLLVLSSEYYDENDYLGYEN